MSFSGWLNSIGFTDQAALTPVQRVNLLMLFSAYHPDSADALDVPTFEQWRTSKGFTVEAELNETQLANLKSLYEGQYPAGDTEPAGPSPADFAETSLASARYSPGGR
jgi:hypothetical protein